jgi:hypothetical protein
LGLTEAFLGYAPSTGWRVTFVLAGLFAIGSFGAVTVRVIASLFGRGPGVLTGYSVAMHNGDVESAGVDARSAFQVTLAFVVLGAWFVAMGILGGAHSDYWPWMHVPPGCAILVLLAWGWIEREFGWPGLFVDPSLKQLPAGGRLRAMRRSAGEEESGVDGEERAAE